MGERVKRSPGHSTWTFDRLDDPYIGLISGTSMDGIDAVLASFAGQRVDCRVATSFPYPAELRETLVDVSRHPDACSLDELGVLDRQVGACFRDAALALLEQAGISPTDVAAIGSHGQTLRHRPDAKAPFSLQIGDPATIAIGTGITTVADFRRADIALGGQGAPLMPPFHGWLFRREDVNRVVLNVGGIANITTLGETLTGFDTGPGNTLMDAWTARHKGDKFDAGGHWAATGTVDDRLLEHLLDDPYFKAEPPKSTGFEYFNLDWLESFGVDGLNPVDVQATLCELTAASVAAAVVEWAGNTTEILVCGGGTHNTELCRRLERALPGVEIGSTASAGLDPDWVEATGFAWLARQTLANRPGNAASVTGADRAAILGAIHQAVGEMSNG